MMLVHKPHSVLPMPYQHRRHPSAPPAVIVQPTRTPGLLSLSKPAQQQHQNRPLPQRQLPSQQRHQANTSPKVVRALAPAAEISSKLLPAAHISPPRGRPAKNAIKDKSVVTRSASPSSLRGKHNRQPSPPVPQAVQESSQAEASSTANQFDPFLDNSTNNPTLASRPSGKLARRRQQQQSPMATPPSTPTPQHAKAIPVPKNTRTRPNSNNNNNHQQQQQLSRSVPLPIHTRPRVPNPKRNSASAVPTDPFPICDDLTDAGDMSDADGPPATPTRAKKAAHSHSLDAPRTAPLTGRTPGAFPFNLGHSPSPAPTKKGGSLRHARQHRRTPSEGVFQMSSDEELSFSSTGSASGGLNPSVQALFGLIRTPGKASSSTPPPSSRGFSFSSAPSSPFSTPVPSRAHAQAHGQHAHLTSAEREAELEKDAEREVKGYFASSAFQNSPSPEELPDPLFV